MSGMKFQVIQFSDRIWLNDQIYLNNYDFYAIDQESGIPIGIDGFLGVTTKSSDEPSFLKGLQNAGLIKHSVVGL